MPDRERAQNEQETPAEPPDTVSQTGATGVGAASDASPLPPAADAAAAHFLAAIVDSSDDAIVSKDLDGIITSWNRAAERLFGYTAEEAIGQSIRMIIPADRQSEEDEVLRRIRSGGRVDHFETVRVRKDGSVVELSLTISPVRDNEGRIIGASKIARDISVRRAAEAAARESVEIKDEFLSMVSHELRTPVAIIVGNGQLLLKRGDELPPAERKQSFLDITQQGERLQRIIENLLVLTRIDAEEGNELQPLDLGSIVEASAGSFERRFPDRRLVVRVESATPALGQPTLVGLLLENLIGNALKYSSDGDVDVIVAARDGRPGVRVLDRGIGVDDASTEVLFEPFYRAPEARVAAGGMGLGLAVCRKIVEALGGTIVAASRPGGGSEFAFWLTPPRPV